VRLDVHLPCVTTTTTTRWVPGPNNSLVPAFFRLSSLPEVSLLLHALLGFFPELVFLLFLGLVARIELPAQAFLHLDQK